jgi:D-glycero-D-manno-heptose 1,7-bisphosphate phosphatase
MSPQHDPQRHATQPVPTCARRAVFLDRDGTLTEPRHYPRHPDDLILQPNIGAPLRALQKEGYALIVATNQSGIARGMFNTVALQAMHERLRTLLGEHGVRLDGIYACPHHPEGSVPEYRVVCVCRKPSPGMLWRAAHEYDLDLVQSWMVGDSDCDVQAGRQAGTRTALVGSQRPCAVQPNVRHTTTSEALYEILQSHSR